MNLKIADGSLDPNNKETGTKSSDTETLGTSEKPLVSSDPSEKYSKEEIALMDVYAGQAMQGMMSSPRIKKGITIGEIAIECYQQAQVMLLQRRKVLGEEKV